MKLVNLTPHVINVGPLAIAPSGEIARVSETSRLVGKAGDLDLIAKEYGQVTGVPEPQDGTLFIVSAMVRLACLDRPDLASPGDQIRNVDGKIVGVKNLVVNPKPLRAQLVAQQSEKEHKMYYEYVVARGIYEVVHGGYETIEEAEEAGRYEAEGFREEGLDAYFVYAREETFE